MVREEEGKKKKNAVQGVKEEVKSRPLIDR
jgi:hypothetical protein